jgi:hypothetical protein
MDLTQLSQQDEHLRRARSDEPIGTVRPLLLEIADYLTSARPMDRMAEASRVYLASAKGSAGQVMNSDQAAENTRALLALMPHPYASETRGEYALRLRAAAKAS